MANESASLFLTALKAASESADNIGAALGLVAEEIGKAYKRLRDTLG